MGSKTPQDEYEGGNGHPSNSDKSSNAGGEPRGSHTSRDGDGCLGNGNSDAGDGDGDSGEVNGALADGGDPTEAAKKKRKKRNNKKKKKAGLKQTSPPRVPLSDLFPTGDYPKGELQSYGPKDDTTVRTTAAEARADDRQVYWEDEDWLRQYRKGAEIHRQVRQWAQENVIKPGKTTLEIAEGIEESVRALLGNSGLEYGSGRISGMGFPTGVCLNHQVAHYTPNPGQKEVILKESDVVTVDFGVQINGWIVDSAFTVAFDPVYDNLLTAVKDATNTGIKTAGIDVRISDVSAAIQEAMESYEVELEGKTFPIKAIRNLTGHNIVQNHIHGGKSIPFVKNKDQTKMEEGEVFAIETFGSTGRGHIVDDVGVYGYALNHDTPLKIPVALSSAKKLHKTIRDNFGTIPFCRRYLERLGTEKYLAGMNCLVGNGIVEEYGLLRDIKGSYSAQFEHTFIQRETCKEVLSRGDDY